MNNSRNLIKVEVSKLLHIGHVVKYLKILIISDQRTLFTYIKYLTLNNFYSAFMCEI